MLRRIFFFPPAAAGKQCHLSSWQVQECDTNRYNLILLKMLLQQQTNTESIRILLKPSQGHQHHSVAVGHAKHGRTLDSLPVLFPPSMFKGAVEQGEHHSVPHVLREVFLAGKFSTKQCIQQGQTELQGIPKPCLCHIQSK